MAPPFANTTPVWLYVMGGILITLVVIAVTYILYLHRRRLDSSVSEGKEQDNDLRMDNIGLSKKSEDLLTEIIDNPGLQNELPSRLDVSKATVSNAISELKDRGLIIRKKKANTYLIEPDKEELEKQQR